MELKDLFAAHVAAALAHRIERPDVIATRAYDLADALLRERGRRDDSTSGRRSEWFEDEEAVLQAPDLVEDDSMPGDEFFRPFAGLLDEPTPVSEREGLEVDPAWLDRDNEPRWEAEKWVSAGPPTSDKPGLKRTVPGAADSDKTRKQA